MKYEYELKRVKKVRSKEIKKSIYKNPLSIFAAIITVMVAIYIAVNLPKQRSIKAVETMQQQISETF
ncbi:MAG: hypothetical protein JNJ40_16355 [Bacteroidia bacterium]|nr:hypothetical protein [Bacteroidia bacterium]